MVKELLRLEAQADGRDWDAVSARDVQARDNNKQTLLHVASTGVMARLFLHAGADVDAKDEVRGSGRN